MGGSLISQSILDNAVGQAFGKEREEEIVYGNLKLSLLMFQDDLCHVVDSVKKAKSGNINEVRNGIGVE